MEKKILYVSSFLVFILSNTFYDPYFFLQLIAAGWFSADLKKNVKSIKVDLSPQNNEKYLVIILILNNQFYFFFNNFTFTYYIYLSEYMKLPGRKSSIADRPNNEYLYSCAIITIHK